MLLFLLLTKTGRKILAYLTEHPERITGARRFADYYLDTAAHLVDKYMDLQNNGLTETAGSDITAQTVEGLKMLNTAFENQLNRLLDGDRMEIETEIRVLKEAMKTEGDS